MPHIDLDENLPGIRALLAFSPETAKPLGELTELLLRSNEGLSPAEREMIATHVSYLNDCFYCHQSHGAIVSCYLNGDNETVNAVKRDYQAREVTGTEKSVWWERAVATWPDYARYQTKTDRQIPVFVLEPIE